MQTVMSVCCCLVALASITMILNGCGERGPPCTLNGKQKNVLTSTVEDVIVKVSWGDNKESLAGSPCCDGWTEVLLGGVPNQTYKQACGPDGSFLYYSFKGASCDMDKYSCQYIGDGTYYGLPDSCCVEIGPPQCNYQGGFCHLDVGWWDAYCDYNPCGNGFAIKVKNMTDGLAKQMANITGETV